VQLATGDWQQYNESDEDVARFWCKTERKRPLGSCRSRWEDIIMDFKETSWESMDCNNVA
jgi:hypothetical protein